MNEQTTNNDIGIQIQRLSDAVADLTSDMKSLKDSFEEYKKENQPINDLFRGSVAFSKLVIGFSGTLLAIGAIGSAIVWVITKIMHIGS